MVTRTRILRSCFAWLLFLPLVAGSALATELGDTAPALKIADWIKGDPVDLASGKGENVYVVEFWATWCGPCRQSIPHLTELQEKYRDRNVVFIGISDEPEKTVAPYVKSMGDKMNYTVASDDDRQTMGRYMSAFGVSGIPHAFVVDKSGVIAWHGHPMANLEGVLDQILDGTYDLAGAKLAAQGEKLLPEFIALITSGEDNRRADELGERVLELMSANADLLNGFAWFVLTNENVKHRNLELAMRVAKTAYDVSEGKNASIVDTYARAFFETGDVEKAIAYEKKAIDLARNEEMRKILTESLRKFEAAAAK